MRTESIVPLEILGSCTFVWGQLLWGPWGPPRFSAWELATIPTDSWISCSIQHLKVPEVFKMQTICSCTADITQLITASREASSKSHIWIRKNSPSDGEILVKYLDFCKSIHHRLCGAVNCSLIIAQLGQLEKTAGNLGLLDKTLSRWLGYQG